MDFLGLIGTADPQHSVHNMPRNPSFGQVADPRATSGEDAPRLVNYGHIISETSTLANGLAGWTARSEKVKPPIRAFGAVCERITNC